jgi:hypothetical protein
MSAGRRDPLTGRQYFVEPVDCGHPPSQLVEENKYGEDGWKCLKCGAWASGRQVVGWLMSWMIELVERMDKLETGEDDGVDDTK